jgi:nucleoside-diphosphate-sugar epimerase
MQTILGANGTIGLILAKELSKYDEKIRLVSRNPRKVNESDELFPADLSNPSVVDQAVEGSDVVYLTVGFEYKLKVWQKNWPALMKATISACIKHNARLVFFDNVYSYDIGSIPHMTEESPYNPPSKKGQVRHQVVQMILDEVKAGRLLAIIARSADFYGPGSKNSLVNMLVYNNLIKGKRASWPVNVNARHSFTYTPDAAKATAILGNTDDAYNSVWHLPTDRNVLTGKQFIDLFSKEMNISSKFYVMPLWLIKLLGLFIPDLGELSEMMYQYDRDYIFDSSKFEKRFGFVPTTYLSGIKTTIAQSRQD